MQVRLPSLQLPEGCTAFDPISEGIGFHVSLSRVLYVKEMQIELLYKMLQKALTGITLPLEITFSQPAKYVNDEHTCHFLALDCEDDSVLKPLTDVIDEVLKKFGLPTYYSPPHFHISLAWSLDDFAIASNLPPITVQPNQILMKIGKNIRVLK